MKRIFIMSFLFLFLLGCSPDKVKYSSCSEYCQENGFSSGECFDCVHLVQVELPDECESGNFISDKITYSICMLEGRILKKNEGPIEDNTAHGCLCEGTTSNEVNLCQELKISFDNKINSFGVSACDKWAQEGMNPVWVGATLTDISKTYNSAHSRNEFTLIFQGSEQIGYLHIANKEDNIPYKIGNFYKFDLARKCELIFSMASSENYPDPDLNSLVHLPNCE